MNKSYKRARSILTMGILSILFVIGGVALTVSSIISAGQNLAFDPGGNSATLFGQGSSMMILAGILLIIVAGILSLTSAILILSGKYNNDQVDSLKIVMGILTLLIIGPIGAIIFGGIAMSKLKAVPTNPTINADSSI